MGTEQVPELTHRQPAFDMPGRLRRKLHAFDHETVGCRDHKVPPRLEKPGCKLDITNLIRHMSDHVLGYDDVKSACRKLHVKEVARDVADVRSALLRLGEHFVAQIDARRRPVGGKTLGEPPCSTAEVDDSRRVDRYRIQQAQDRVATQARPPVEAFRGSGFRVPDIPEGALNFDMRFFAAWIAAVVPVIPRRRRKSEGIFTLRHGVQSPCIRGEKYNAILRASVSKKPGAQIPLNACPRFPAASACVSRGSVSTGARARSRKLHRP